MDKEEIFDYLNKNLKISISHEGGGDIKVLLYLEGMEIDCDSTHIPIPRENRYE